jgi:sorbitol-specific phosphotransferase system component IIBC
MLATMVKRARGSSRPGQRRPQRPATAPAASPAPRRSVNLTEDEAARAAEYEERMLAEERAANELQQRKRERSREAGVARSSVPLAVRAAAEYAYVRRDVTRILVLIVIQVAILAVLFVLINVTGIIQI